MPEEFLSANKSIKDPIIIDPPGQTAEQVWNDCAAWVEQCGGIAYPDGEANMMAAAGADPGCCTCPNCGQYFWSCGRRIECTECSFQFPTDWWPMYSYGVQDARRLNGSIVCPEPEVNARMLQIVRQHSNERMKHPYYRYGFDHPVTDPVGAAR